MRKNIIFLHKGLHKNDIPSAYLRESFIGPSFIGKTLKIHNGKKKISLVIRRSMVGCRLGDFALTCKFGRIHKMEKKRKKKKKK